MNRAAKRSLLTLIVITLVIWVYFLLHTEPNRIGQPLPIGNSFDGNELLPVKEFKAKYNEGLILLDQLKGQIGIFRLLSTVAEWLTFLLTSLMTIFLGVQGKFLQADAKPAAAAKLLNDHSAKYKTVNKRLMIIASVCSVLVAFNSICKLKLETSLKNAQELSGALYKCRVDWFNAKTAAEASAALQALDQRLINDQ